MVKSYLKKLKIGVFGCINSLGKAKSQDIGIMPSFKNPHKFEIYIGGLLGNSPVYGQHIDIALNKEQLIYAIKFIIEIYQKKWQISSTITQSPRYKS